MSRTWIRAVGERGNARQQSRCSTAQQRHFGLRRLARPAARVRLCGGTHRDGHAILEQRHGLQLSRICASNHLEPSTDLAALDAVFASVNRGRSVEIPTAVGFCMYIRRECLAENGLFDADAFGIGYGEENDFCMRTAARGWKHKLACDVFVYHAGSVSFGPASARQEAAMRVLIDRYPSYPAIVRRHVQMDPANAFRIAVTAQRIRNSGKRARLAVVHTLGGGVAQHARHVAELTSGETIWLTLRPVCPMPAFWNAGGGLPVFTDD